MLTTKGSARRAWRQRRNTLLRTVLAPPPRLSISEWADRYRMLSRESSAEPGKWSTDRAPYQRGIMDAFGDPMVEGVVVMSSAQIGKTEILNNVVAYYVDQDPAPMLVLQPTQQMGEAWSKDRLAPMLRDTPRLKGKIKDPRARDSGNTLLQKQFPGGHITISGANSAASLASRPIRHLSHPRPIQERGQGSRTSAFTVPHGSTGRGTNPRISCRSLRNWSDGPRQPRSGARSTTPPVAPQLRTPGN